MFDDDDRARDWAGGGGWQNDDPPPPPSPPPPPKKRKTKPVPRPTHAYRAQGGRALVAGRFDPLHRGHEHLIEVARRSSEALDVVVFTSPNDAVPASTRMAWIAETFPGIGVYETVSVPDFALAIKKAIKRAPNYDTFYSAEIASGIPAAKAIGATFVPIDPNRETFPVASTQIRADVMGHFDDIAAAARGHFVRRVAIVGPESTGKTELAKRLAQIYSTRWVPEPARALAEVHGGDLEWADIELWTRTQMAAEDAAARHARRVLFSDTEARTPNMWARRMFDEEVTSAELATKNREYDLTLVCLDDIPFVGRPERDDPEGRREMMQSFLRWRERGAIVISGGFEQRVLDARKAVDQLLAAKGFFSKRFG